MPVLSNPKHERFAQELAKGKTSDEAYQLAGYAENRGNATRLKANESVLKRVAELQERSAVRTEVTVASITERLMKLANDAEADADAANRSVARAALMDAAKLNGLVVDKVKTDATIRDERELDDAELAYIARSGGNGTSETTARPN